MSHANPLRILFVEDLPSDAELAEKEIRKGGFEFTSQRVDTKGAFLKALEEFQPDVVVSDYAMPEFDGMQALKLSLERDSTLPFIILTGSMNEETAVECLKSGATNYVIKEHIARLPFAIQDALQQKKVRIARDKAERALEKSEGRFRAITDTAVDSIITIDETGFIVGWNQGATRTFGYTEKEIAGHTLEALMPEKYRGGHKNGLSRIRQGGKPHVIGRTVEMEGKRKDGSEFPLELSISQWESTEGRFFSGIIRDITERKRAEERIKEGQAWLNAILDASRDGIVVEQGESIVYANRAYARLFGYESTEELVGKHISIVQSAEDNERMIQFGRNRLRNEAAPSYYEFKGKRKDGTTALLEAAVSTISILEKQYIVAALRDISERKVLEGQLRQAAKLESIGTLAGGIAHDFNNILGIIMAHTSLVQHGKLGAKELPDAIATILKATERGAALVKQILTFARKGEVTVDAVQVNYIIKELLSLLYQTFPKTIEFDVELDKNLPIIPIDRSQLDQALMNLCVNARDAILEAVQSGKAESRISIRTSTASGAELRKRFASAVSDEYLCVSVSDTGLGMDEETKDRIFEPFFTTKAIGKGTGLGLAVVYGVMQAHQGIIDVQSQLGRGTTFSMYFPVPKRVTKKVFVEKSELLEVSGGEETILVVEDEEALRMLLKNLLQAKGYTVITASDGLEAVEIFEKNKGKIAAVISDHGLPGMNGADAVKKMIAAKRSLKCILASGYIEPQQKSEIFKSGVKEFIQKPYDPMEVVRIVREVLDLK